MGLQIERMVKLYEIAKANLTGKTPDMHDNRKYG
ncbi:pyridoxamine 5'-phosphate oxidase family protein [Kordiimonas gwangyangensis]|nr:pyridoxamine 5'-phosphate oxidase family protein [Kordiimonas gwangyangensis]